MPIPTPFHSRTAALCESHEWRDWSGYLAASVYEPSHEREYYAVRNSAGLFDVSPLFKYEITGPDALRLVNRIITRNAEKCAVGQVLYSPWCDDDGKVIDDGTISRLAERHFRITAAHPNLRWFQDCAFGLDTTVADVSTDLAALALQGPHARNILKTLVGGTDLDALRFFRLTRAEIDGFPIIVTRTGYTGDLGYELWVRPEYAERLWDLLLDRGRYYGLLPAGMVALDISRIEAGFPLVDVDYIPAPKARIKTQTSSPYEIGMGWAVALKQGGFIGHRALITERKQGSKWAFVGLMAHWHEIEALYQTIDLAPELAGRASRASLPVYNVEGHQVGYATSHTYSPLFKKYIALATVERDYAALATHLKLEMTIEHKRRQVTAGVVKLPIFDPARKRA